MTVSKDEQFVYNWFGDGKNTTFDFDFLIENESQLAVYFTNTETSQIKLENGIDYTINEIGNENGSFITFPIEGSKYHILKHDEIISISLELPISQDTPYDESEKLVKSRLERNFDYLTKLIAIQSKQIERAVKIREGSQYNPNEVLSIIFESEEKSKLAKENSQVALDSANLAKDIATAAQNQSDFAIETAQNSNNTALMANENSTTALTNANQALNIAINANQESQEAMDLANLALESAENSNSKVDSFRIETTNQIDDFKSSTNQSIEDFKEEVAEDISTFKSSTNSQVATIEGRVNSTFSAAQEAQEASSNAISTANSAEQKAQGALSTADDAFKEANNARITATLSNETAADAVNRANTANTKADSAIATANTTAQKVDDFAQDIQSVIDAAEQIAQLEESVATAVNASSAATTAASEASTAATNATTAANNATQAVEDALEATQRVEDLLAEKAASADLTSHTTNKSNPHGVTKGQLGLGNVDNTSDINKPISNATQTALNNKLDVNGTAVKATADGSGNNIVNTYLTKSSASSTYAVKSNSLAGYGITNAYTKSETYTKTEVDSKLLSKSDKSTTLNGYGITNAYTKTEIDELLKDVGGLYIGQIIPSLLPLTDAGLHLLDGALINGDGIYKAFVNYISKLDLTASYFTTEADWQASVEQYGVCGKFVYDASANTVRLPKVTGILEGTIDASALGDLVEAGLPNITGDAKLCDDNNENIVPRSANPTGCYIPKTTSQTLGNYNSSSTTGNGCTFDASASNPIYGNSDTVQPQTIKGYYYIVIATSAKTDIEVNIDNVVTDLNNKVDISNMVDASSYIANCAMPSNKYISLTLGAAGTTYTAPANGWFILNRRAGAAGQYVNLENYSLGLIWGGSDVAYAQYDELGCVCPIKKGDVVKVHYNATGNIDLFVFVYAQGSESEAQ